MHILWILLCHAGVHSWDRLTRKEKDYVEIGFNVCTDKEGDLFVSWSYIHWTPKANWGSIQRGVIFWASVFSLLYLTFSLTTLSLGCSEDWWFIQACPLNICWLWKPGIMPVMKGLLAPQNTFLDTIATRFDGTRKYWHKWTHTKRESAQDENVQFSRYLEGEGFSCLYDIAPAPIPSKYAKKMAYFKQIHWKLSLTHLFVLSYGLAKQAS